MRKEKFSRNLVLLIFIVTITGEVVRMMTSMTTMPQDKVNFLPEAHTCFNQLVLPDYKKKVMEMVTTNYVLLMMVMIVYFVLNRSCCKRS